MKLTMTRVLTPLAALAIAFSAQADLVANEGFEGSALSDGWYFAAGQDEAPDASAITAYGDLASGGLAKPTNEPDAFAGKTNNNYLKLSTEDGILFRNLDGTTDDEGEQVDLPETGLYLDTVVQFTVTDKNDAPQPTDEDKFVIWLESTDDPAVNSLRVYAGQLTANGGSLALSATKRAYTITNIAGIEPGSWHRLTVKAVPALAANVEFPAFQIYIDGELASCELAPIEDGMEQDVREILDSETADMLGAGNYFLSMVEGGTLASVGFSGEGKIDDVVLTSEMPNSVPGVDLTVTWEGDELASVYIGGKELAKGETIRLEDGYPFALDPNDDGISFTPAEGYAMNGFAFDTFMLGEAEIEPNESGVYEIEAAEDTLTIVYTYTEPTWPFTLDWEGSNVESVSYTVNGEGGATITEGVNTTIDVKSGDVIAVEVVYADGYEAGEWRLADDSVATLNGTIFTIGTLAAENKSAGTGIIVSKLSPPRPFSVGTDTYSLAELNVAIAGSLDTSANALTFNASTTLAAGESIVVPEGKTLYVDLAGQTLTAAGTAFTVAASGTLNIADTVGGGKVVATTACVSIAAGATCNISGGSFSDAVAGATFPAGYGLVKGKFDTYDYTALTYTITYDANTGSGDAPANTTFTVLAAGVIAENTFTAPTGKAFNGWNTAADGSGTAYAVGATTPAVTTDLAATTTLYAQWVDSGKELEPGEQDDTKYDDETAAKEAAAGITVAAAPAVVEALTADGALAAYLGKFEVKQVQKDTKWVNEVALTAAAASDLQTQANNDAVAVLSDEATTITTTPGFYYSLKQGGTLDGMAEGTRVLATGDSLSFEALGLDKSGNAGFYKVLVNIAPKAAE